VSVFGYCDCAPPRSFGLNKRASSGSVCLFVVEVTLVEERHEDDVLNRFFPVLVVKDLRFPSCRVKISLPQCDQ
jgi:hypothetical protein